MPIARVIYSQFYIFSYRTQFPSPKSGIGFGEDWEGGQADIIPIPSLRCFRAFLHEDGADEQHNANDDLRDPGGKQHF